MSAGEQKIQEYIERIKNGENKDELMKDLPPSFIEAIEKGLYQETLSDLPEEVVFENDITHDEDNSEEINSIRGDLFQNFNTEKEVVFEKYDISIPNLDEVIKNGGGQLEVVANGNKVDFEELVLTIDGDVGEIMFIKKKDRTQNKGIGVDLYVEIGRRLAEKNIKFYSSAAQYGPGRDLWMKLAEGGFAEKKGGLYVFKDKDDSFGHNEIFEKYSLFHGAVVETVKHHYKDMLYVYKEIKNMYLNDKNTVSNKTVDMLATLGAAKDQMDMIKLTSGDKDYLKQIIDDFDKAFKVIDNEIKK